VIERKKSENGSKKVFVIPDNKLSVEENKSYFFKEKSDKRETLYQKCNSLNHKKTIFEKKLNNQHGEAVQPHHCIKDIFQKQLKKEKLKSTMGSPPWLATMLSLLWISPWLAVSAAPNSVNSEHTNCSYDVQSETLQCFLPTLGSHNSSAIQSASRAGIIRVECIGLGDSELGPDDESILRTNHFGYLPSLRRLDLEELSADCPAWPSSTFPSITCRTCPISAFRPPS
jgi:hypothetical protein